MSSDINYKNNPLHGLGLQTLVEEIVDHYGFEILYAYLQLNCFNTNPSTASSVKFLKKTEWAREKVEEFYLYQFKSLPKASAREFSIAPRDRIVPDDHRPGEPASLSLEDAARLQVIRAEKAAEYERGGFKGNKNISPRKQAESESYSDNTRSHSAKQKQHREAYNKAPEATASAASPSTSSDNFDPWAKAKNKLSD
ncbi:MAG: DUF2132 domain-containing protein [Gammaproteobacteria bacterium]|nr:DUF2132 domain-containing protein [Gammaproteobacteria bacterium]